MVTGCHLGQFTVQVNHLVASGTLVQVVHILRDNGHMEIFFQFRQQFVPPVRFHLQQLFASFVIEIDDQFRIRRISFRGSHLFHRILIPQSSCIAERTDTTLRTHARTCQYNQIFHILVLLYVRYMIRYRVHSPKIRKFINQNSSYSQKKDTFAPR